MPARPNNARSRAVLAVFCLIVAAPTAAASPVVAGTAARSPTVADNGQRTHCNGGGNCCKNHPDSPPCEAPATICEIEAWLPECVPA